jgi:hypothetical protein
VAHVAGGESIFGTSIWAKGATIAAEAAIGGAGSVAEGGDFLSGAIGSLGGALWELSGGNFMVRTAIAAAAGGTAAEIGGGSFEHGAISAAYTYMFNHAAVDVLDLDRDPTESELRRDTRMFPDAADEVGPAFAGAASQTAGMALDFFPQERLLAAVGRFFRGFGRFFGLGGRTTGEIVKDVNLVGRIGQSGMTTRQAGEFFGWGSKEITKPLSSFSREGLEGAGWTKYKLLYVAQGYRKLAKVTPNKSDPLRAEQLENLSKLSEN